MLRVAGQFHSKLVGALEVPRLALAYQKYDVLALLEDVRRPPVKRGLVLDALGECILRTLQRMGLLEV